MIPDAEALVVAYLRTDDEIEAIVGDRIATRHPDSRAEPWIKVSLIADPVVTPDSSDHFIEAHLQLDCYGGASKATSEDEAVLLRRLVRAALTQMNLSSHDGAVVTCVEFGGTGSQNLPDTSFEPARPRYILDAFVYCHDAPGGS